MWWIFPSFLKMPSNLDTLAKENQVTAIVDCGVAPGMSNLILGYYNERMESTRLNVWLAGCQRKGFIHLNTKPLSLLLMCWKNIQGLPGMLRITI